ASRPLESALRRRVLGWRWGGDLIAYWPLEDDRDAEAAASPLPGVQPLILGGEFRFAADSTTHRPSAAGGTTADQRCRPRRRSRSWSCARAGTRRLGRL